MEPSFDSIRAQFPALEDKVFLDAACVSVAPNAAVAATSTFLDGTLRCPARSSTIHHIAMDEAREAARTEAARLIGAEPDEIALVESTTHGLSIAARAVPIGPGDNLLDRRILVSVRYTSGVGGVRVSCHFVNSVGDLDQLLNAVEDYVRRS